jgi:hypothetical protein
MKKEREELEMEGLEGDGLEREGCEGTILCFSLTTFRFTELKHFL